MAGHKRKLGRRRGADEKVIHVVFGPGGGRVARDASATASPALLPEQREPVTDLFTRTEVSRLLHMSAARLTTLDRAGLSPSGRQRSRRAYTFSDLIAVRTAQALLEQNVPLRRVTRCIRALKRALPKVTRPLGELRIASD